MTREVTVSIIVDPNFGDRLKEVAVRGPVWIAATPVNRAAAECWWSAHSPPGQYEGVTTFLVADDQSPEQWCAVVLPTVDLHYGAYDDNPPMYDAVEVWGATPVALLLEYLSANGYDKVTSLGRGFRASRDVRAV